MAMDEAEIVLKLTEEEALVFFEWLARMDSERALPTEDPSEQEVLWVLEGQLERLLVQPLADHYPEAVAAARKKVRELHGGGKGT